MTLDGYAALRQIFFMIIKLFNSWYIPGTHVTPLSMMILIAFSSFFIRFVRNITNSSSNITGVVKNFTNKGGDQ